MNRRATHSLISWQTGQSAGEGGRDCHACAGRSKDSAIQQRCASESTDLGVIDLVDAPMVRAYTDRVRLAQCLTQIATLDGTIDQLDNAYEDVTPSLNLAKAEADSLNAQISDPAPTSPHCSRR